MKEAVAHALLEIGAVGFSPHAPITFKSGIISPVYVDNRRLPYHPDQWHIVIEGFKQLIADESVAASVIAGVAVGGVPHSSALGYVTGLPSIFIRKEAKGHGRGQRIEGGSVDGQHVLLVEDLVTTGGSSLSAIAALQEEGAQVDTMLAIVSYGFEEAQKNFHEAQIALHTLTDFEVILDVARKMGKFNDADEAIIRDWFDDPHNWAKRQGKL